MRKYFTYNLQIFMSFLLANLLTCYLFAMEHEPFLKEATKLPLSIIDQYVEYINNDNDIKHDEITEFLKNNVPRNLIFEEFLSPALRSQIIEEGLKINYLDPTIDFLDPLKEDYLFHGTRSTLEILDRYELVANESLSGWGIFFGRTFKTSLPYTTNQSSNINNTCKDTFVRSVLILVKEKYKNFIYNNAGPTNLVMEYILLEELYSLRNLNSIVFSSQGDIKNFLNFFKSQPKDIQLRLRTLSLYSMDYHPLSEKQNKNEFIYLLKKHQDLLLQDKHFLTFLLEAYGTSLGENFFLSTVKALENIDELAGLIFVKCVEGNFWQTASYVAQKVCTEVLIKSFFKPSVVKSFLNIKSDKKIFHVVPYEQAIKNHRDKLLNGVRMYLPLNLEKNYSDINSVSATNRAEEVTKPEDIF